jgi:two-component system, NtrC family, nitrogen regulation sensor histidine kinase NtrY
MKMSFSMGKIPGFPALAAGIVLVIILYAIHWWGKTIYRPEVQCISFSKTINEKISGAEKTLKAISDKTKKNYYYVTEFSDLIHPGETEEGIYFYVFSGDSLVFWSDNAVTLPETDILKRSLDGPVIFLKDGWYKAVGFTSGRYMFAALILLRNQYPFQNDYLQNGFAPGFRIDDETRISAEKGRYNITGPGGKFICSLIFPAAPSSYCNPYLEFLLFTGAFLFLLIFLYRIYHKLRMTMGRGFLLYLGFVTDVLIIRTLQWYFEWPSFLSRSMLFSPGLFYSSPLLPSLGDLVINSVILLVISYAFYLEWPSFWEGEKKGPRSRAAAIAVFTVFIVFAFAAAGKLIAGMVGDSSIPLNLRNISSLDADSLLAFSALAFVFLSIFLAAARLFGLILQRPGSDGDGRGSVRPAEVLVFVLVAAMFSTIVLNRNNDRMEREKRKIIAMKLSARRNPVTEVLLGQISEKIKTDSMVNSNHARPSDTTMAEDANLAGHLVKKYFRESWNNYTVQITVCRPGKMLNIQPQGYIESCNAYFERIIRDFGQETQSPLLYYLDYGYGNENYLIIIPVEPGKYTLYTEISSKLAFKDLGYPELLVDKKLVDLPDLSDYSYAMYQKGQLVQRVGKFAYSFGLDAYVKAAGKEHFFSSEGMNHYIYHINGENTLIISKPAGSLFSDLSPFSYLVIFFAFTASLFYIITHFDRLKGISVSTLRNRLQLSMVGIILSSFIIVGIVLMIFLVRLNTEKDKDALLERALSILTEMQHKYGSMENFNQVGQEELENTLTRYSNIFFSDINLYNPDGMLIASSRTQIFDEGLQSGLMNRQALDDLQDDKTSIYVHNEHIGNHSFYSAYLPMYNNDNNLVGYINLPYFSKQADLKREISTFLIAFINLYVLFILLAVLLGIAISGYITAPLKMLAGKIKGLKFGTTNEKIEWKRQDEIGKLVDEYNRMLDELAASAEKLAISERESAWREMARQVAHEIKNPLTPMKLSTQYLQKAWEEKAGDWDTRLKRFTDALIEQIDSLSAIAGEFSDFAKMPETSNEKLPLNGLITSALSFYNDLSHIEVMYDPCETGISIFADRKQILRVFTNILNNAVQAIGDEKGTIRVHVETHGGMVHINFKDSGEGIGDEQAGRIFQPNFTTKSGGTGLGLAIVREILRSQGGQITFSSEPGIGTTFTVILPAYYGNDEHPIFNE